MLLVKQLETEREKKRRAGGGEGGQNKRRRERGWSYPYGGACVLHFLDRERETEREARERESWKAKKEWEKNNWKHNTVTQIFWSCERMTGRELERPIQSMWPWFSYSVIVNGTEWVFLKIPERNSKKERERLEVPKALRFGSCITDDVRSLRGIQVSVFILSALFLLCHLEMWNTSFFLPGVHPFCFYVFKTTLMVLHLCLWSPGLLLNLRLVGEPLAGVNCPLVEFADISWRSQRGVALPL